jgi:ArsR family transcriptional regulator
LQAEKPLDYIRLPEYTVYMKQATQTFKALSDETRLRILGLLLQGELCVCDLVVVLNLPQSTISRHLSYLKNSGLVEDRREGVWMHYQLKKSAQTDLANLLNVTVVQLSQIKKDRERLRKHLARKQSTVCS